MNKQKLPIRQAYNYLRNKGIVHTQKDVSEKLNIVTSNLSKAFNGDNEYLTIGFVERFNNAFNNIFDTNWLLTGEGEMLVNADSNHPIINTNKGVPYYNVDFIGGFDLVENEQTTTPDYYIDFQKYNTADCWCNVTGHSMEPAISSGDIIALKEIKDWAKFLPFGEIYAIVTSEHRTIKKVTGSLNPERFLLIPLNPDIEFQPQEIPTSIIVKVYKVLGCVKKF